MNFLLGLLTFVLVVVSILLILVVLMQRAKSDAGMGAVMGGTMAEATFGADTTNVLSKATIRLAVVFFLLAVGLFLGRIYQHTHAYGGGALPTIAAPAPAPMSMPFAPPAAPANTPPASIARPAPSAAPSAAK